MAFKETALKASGHYGRYRAIKSMITGGIAVVVGIVLAIFFNPKALILSLVGLVGVGWGWIIWKRSKTLLKGKFM